MSKTGYIVLALVTFFNCVVHAQEKYREDGVPGEWIVFHSTAAPFPHPRTDTHGYENASGKHFGKEFFQDDRIAMFVPDRVKSDCAHVDAVVYFHGVKNNVDRVRTHKWYKLGEKIVRANACAVAIVPQGPLNIWGHFWGKMEDEGGLKKLLDACLKQMGTKFVLFTHLIVSGQSGGFEGVGRVVRPCEEKALTFHPKKIRPGTCVRDPGSPATYYGGVKADAVFIFDALYALQENIRDWLVNNPAAFIYGAHTQHLEGAYNELESSAKRKGVDKTRIMFIPADVVHPKITGRYFEEWVHAAFLRLHSAGA